MISPFVLVLVITCSAAIAILLAYLAWHIRKTLPREKGFGLNTQMLRVGNFDLCYHVSGRGPFLLLLHGIGADLQCWRYLVPHLNKHFTVVALDLPGFGRSSKITEEGYGLDEQTKRISCFLEALSIQQTFVAGSSMGGNLALWLALRNAQKIQALVLIAPPTKILPISIKHWVWVARPLSYFVGRSTLRWLHRITVSNRDLISHERVEETLKIYSRQPEAISSLIQATETLSDTRLVYRLNEIEHPVLILWGARDRLVSSRLIERLKVALPRAKSAVHSSGGHHLQEDEPQWVADKIRTFFTT